MVEGHGLRGTDSHETVDGWVERRLFCARVRQQHVAEEVENRGGALRGGSFVEPRKRYREFAEVTQMCSDLEMFIGDEPLYAAWGCTGKRLSSIGSIHRGCPLWDERIKTVCIVFTMSCGVKSSRWIPKPGWFRHPRHHSIGERTAS